MYTFCIYISWIVIKGTSTKLGIWIIIFNYIYRLCYYNYLNFPPCPPPFNNPHSLSLSPHHCSCPWVIHVSSLATPFPILEFISHGYSVTTYLYFLIPSPLHPFSPTPLPSGNHQNVFCIYDSTSVLPVCLVCFLDSIVHRYIFFAILLFIVLIFYFLSKSL